MTQLTRCTWSAPGTARCSPSPSHLGHRPARGFPVLTAGLGGDPLRLEVQVAAATPEQAASLSADHAGLLVVTSFLTPLQP